MEENRKIDGNLPLIDREYNGNMLLIDRELEELKDDAEYVFLSKLTELVKKSSNLTRIGKEKPHCRIFYSLAYFIELFGQPCFCIAEGLAGLTNSLAMDRAELRGREIAVGFSR